MSNDDYDEHVEYVDEDGNPIDPAELGDDVEFVDEEITEDTTGHQQAAPEPAQGPAQEDGTSPFGLLPEDDEPVYVPEVAHQPDPGPAPAGDSADQTPAGVPKGLILGGVGILAAAALVVGGGLWMWQGPSNTVDEVKDQVAAATEGELPEVDACDGTMIRDAEITGRTKPPTMQFEVIDAVTLPAQMGTKLREQGSTAQVQLLQQTDRSVTIYLEEKATPPGPGEKKATPPEFPWWTTTVNTAGGLAVAGESGGMGGDADAASACASVPSVGAYAASGSIPDSARGMREGQIEVAALKPDGARPEVVFLVAGDQLLEAELQWDEEEADAQHKAEKERAKQEGQDEAANQYNKREAEKNTEE